MIRAIISFETNPDDEEFNICRVTSIESYRQHDSVKTREHIFSSRDNNLRHIMEYLLDEIGICSTRTVQGYAIDPDHYPHDKIIFRTNRLPNKQLEYVLLYQEFGLVGNPNESTQLRTNNIYHLSTLFEEFDIEFYNLLGKIILA